MVATPQSLPLSLPPSLLYIERKVTPFLAQFCIEAVVSGFEEAL